MRLNLDKFNKKKQKKEDNSNLLFEDSDNSFVDLVNQEDKPKREGYFKRNPKNKWLLIFVIAFAIPLTIVYNSSEKTRKEEEKAKEKEVNSQLSEVHTNIGYYLINGTVDQKFEATGLLVGHIMDTGCSSGYLQLMRAYDDDSLQYVQDFLRGHPCSEYEKSNVVLLNTYKSTCDYLIVTDRRDTKYKLTITYLNNQVTAFVLSKYITQDKIVDIDDDLGNRGSSLKVEEQNTEVYEETTEQEKVMEFEDNISSLPREDDKEIAVE